MTNATTARRFTVLGTTDEVTTCDCCGRSDLKSTVALNDGDNGDAIVHFGCVCAARAMNVASVEVRKAARDADAAKVRAEMVARAAAADAEYARTQAWLDAKVGPKGERFRQLEALGGYRAAMELYRAEVA